ncbi:MAG: hypothetical protein KKA62_02210 [Nanoarchaeota archaeon]|nr:hypothetical protein [Nanoarchaeota archaeon]
MSNFFQTGRANKAYEVTRDASGREVDKKRIEEMWSMYEPYGDRDFKNKAMEDGQFTQCMWEMHLACTLLNGGHTLQERVRHSGPDCILMYEEQPYLIEARAPNAGTGPDAVPDLVDGVVNTVPEENIILRITQSIVEKYEQHQNWLSKGIVSHTDPLVVAINISDASMISGDFMPYVLKAVFGFEHARIHINPETNAKIGNSWSFRAYIEKKNGERINTTYFQVPKYSSISAIIYSGENILYKPEIMGEEFTIVHNPFAGNPIPHNLLKFGTEYWVDEEKLLQKIVHMKNKGVYISQQP